MWRKPILSIFAVVVLGLVSVADAGVVVMQCDVGGCGPLQSGWISLGSCGTFADVGGTGIDVTLATGNPGACECRNPGPGGTGTLAEVEWDLLFANDEETSPGSDFIITFSNLMPGANYRLLSYHSRTDEGMTTIPNVTVTGATDVTVPASIVQDDAIMDNPAEILFTAGAGDVIIRYLGPLGGCAGCQAFFNGFVLELNAPTLTFESYTSGGMETISPALVPVNLINPEPGETYTVQYDANGGTATPGDDYSLTPGTLIFSPGQTTKNIIIDIVDDGEPEEDETIILELSNATGLDAVLGIDQHTYTISDTRPKIAFETATSAGLESATPVNIKVRLSHAGDETVTVNYGVTGGTAAPGADYTLLGDGTLTFEPPDVIEYVSINVIDDAVSETQETIHLGLSDPCNATLGTPAQHTYSILDNEQGVYFDGLIWYYSDSPTPLYVNELNQFVWVPEKNGQFITRLPEQRLSQVGDKVELSYWWMTDGEGHESHPECEIGCQRNDEGCPCDYDDDIQCVAGTSDMRAGFFEADGEYIMGDGFEVYGSSIFTGYKGYGFRFGPHMDSYPTRWEDCQVPPEVHKTGQFQKKPVSLSNLLSTNDGLSGNDDPIPGFELPPGEWSLWTISLERLSSSSVELSITLNDRTYTWTDNSSSDQPSKIDVFAVTMRNGRPYDILSLEPTCRPPAGDIDGDGLVDWNDLRVMAGYWLDQCCTGEWCEGSDIDHSRNVSPVDFAILATDWLQSCSSSGQW